ncbi:MAG: DUF5615 family PIN-like protein [Chloroflexi bacterium]|nr:DUF5615 family PIN-like protein [Chloroflexota bacterium]
MVRLYANENFPLPVVEELRRLGYDVTTTFETGQAGQAVSDVQVLAFAKTEKRVLLTLNRKHFVKLHQTDFDHYGIVACTFDPNFVALAQRI